jgi:concanavalin A-like lectin/glucanase superfamily protein
VQRIYLISAAAAIAIVAILLVGRGSKTSWVDVGGPGSDGSEAGDGSLASLDAGGDRGDLDSDGGSGSLKGRSRRAPHGAERGAAAGRASTGPGGGDRGSGTTRRGGAAAVVGGGQRSGGGVVGQGVGHRAEGGGGSASIAGGGASGGEDSKGGGTRDRSQVMPFLAEPAKGVGGGGSDKPADGAQGADDVVLSVPLNKDTGVQAADATAPVAEQDLKFADDGVGVHFEPGSVLAFPDAGNMKGDAGSLQLDVDPEWSGSDGGDFALVNVREPNDPSNLLRIFKNGRYLRFLFADSSGQERDISAPIDDWEPGQQRRITATWGDGTTNLYIDGNPVGHNTYDNPFEIRPGTPLYLGSDVPQAPATGASATISNFQVFGRALGVDEIGSR